jgi:hypothetical protein
LSYSLDCFWAIGNPINQRHDSVIFIPFEPNVLAPLRLRDTRAIQGLAIYGILVGVTIVGLYSWSISRYQSVVDQCQNISVSNVNLCTWTQLTFVWLWYYSTNNLMCLFFIYHHLHIQVVEWLSIPCSLFAEFWPWDSTSALLRWRRNLHWIEQVRRTVVSSLFAYYRNKFSTCFLFYLAWQQWMFLFFFVFD